jgi:hypothetical protein
LSHAISLTGKKKDISPRVMKIVYEKMARKEFRCGHHGEERAQ